MDVQKNQIDDLNAVLTVNIKREDIDENVNNALKDYRKKANVPGFRPGKVPMGMIKKMYGNALIADELNKAVSKALYEYIQKEELKILGDPLPSEDQKQVDFDKATEYNFLFDVGIAPELEINLTKRDKVTEYVIQVDEKTKQSYIENYQKRFGNFVNVETANEKSVVKGEIFQTDEQGNILENGIQLEEVSLDISLIKDEEIKKQFIGSEANKTIDFDVKKAYENETEISSMLNIKKEEVENLNPNFRITINEIRDFKEAEINQELFDKTFGEGVVNSQEEFEKRVEENISESFALETNYLLAMDIKQKYIEKFDIKLPEEFLKRWLMSTNKEISKEDIDKDFAGFLENLKWTLIKNQIAKDNEIKVSEEDLLDAAKESMAAQFRKYGIGTIPEEHLNNYAKEMLEKEEERNRAGEQKLEEKVIQTIKESIKVEQQEVTLDEIKEIFDEKMKVK